MNDEQARMARFIIYAFILGFGVLFMTLFLHAAYRTLMLYT